MPHHTFNPTTHKADKCQICNMMDFQHGTCEICKCDDYLVSFKQFALCPECYQNQIKNTQAMTTAQSVNDKVKEIDSQVQVSTDLFNAHTIAIADIKAMIDADDSVTNKPYQFACILKERFEHFKEVVFEKQKEIMDAQNGMKAIQVQLNNLANSLRAEEREKLKIQDINYKPNQVNVKKQTVTDINKPKKLFTQADVKRVAKELGMSEIAVNMLCVSKGTTPDVIKEMIKGQLNKAQ